jgi:hypothetical protein
LYDCISVYQHIRCFKNIIMGGELIVSNKIKIPVLLVVLFTFFIFAGFSIISASAEEPSGKTEVKKEATQQKEKNSPYTKAKITTKIIPSANKTFGYDILVNGKLLVHQPSIPALPGNDGFKTKEQAKKVADFVVKKIRKNEMPPTVKTDDLKSMKVLKDN